MSMVEFSAKRAAGLRSGVAGFALVGAALAAPAALAQDTNPDDIAGYGDEIIVTARSTGETLLQVPVAVTAFGADQLANSAATDLTKIAQMAPQLEIYAGGAGSGGSFLIRGIGTTADTAGVDMSVSLSLDGTQVARPRTVYAGMFDLKQVSVMKGPQALFFGRNATAGVVAIESADPSDILEGYVRGGYEFKARERYVEAALSIPVTETLGVRFAGRYSKLRGWVRNDARPYANDPFNPTPEVIPLPGAAWKWGPGSDNKGGRITLKWEPGSIYSSTMKATFLKYSDVSGTATAEPVCFGQPTTYGVWDGISDCKINGRVAQGQLPPQYAEGPVGDPKWFSGVPYSNMTATLLTWQQSLDLGSVLVQSNTGYSKHKFGLRGSYTGMEFVDFHGGVDENYWGVSQELRFISQFDGPFNLTLGGYFEQSRNNHSSALFLFNSGRDPDTGSYQAGFNEATGRTKIYSVFGQARYDILPNLELAGGVRYTKTRKSAVQGQPRYVHQLFDPALNPASPVAFLLPEGQLLHSRLKEDNWSPEATLTWQPTPNQTLYAAYKTGYKSGGIAMPSLVTGADTATSVMFAPEKAKGFEVGYKAEMLNRRLRFEAIGYHYKFTGLQLTSFDPPSSSYKIQNAADAKQYGVELSGSYRVTDELTFRGSAAYNHLDYKRFDLAPCWTNQLPSQGCIGGVQDLSGAKLHRAPRFSGSFGMSYDTPFSNGLMLGLSSDVRYTGSSYASETLSPVSRQRRYALLNATMRVYADDDAWEVAVIGRNLTNERVIGFYQDRSGSVTPGRNEGYAYGSRPREIALQATLRFSRDVHATPAYTPPPPPPAAPAAPPPPPPAQVSCNTGPYIVFFDWDRSDITAEAATVLDNAVTAYGNCNNVPVMVAGHADRSGAARYNVGLSQRRANSVRGYLTSRGIADGAISTQAFGETQNRVPTADGVREPQNRRVEVTYGPGSGN